MEIRKIRPEENIEALKIQSVCFTANRDFSNGGNYEDGYEVVRALFNAEGKMCASLNLHPFRFRMNGQTVNMGGIGGVVSLPEHRNKGYVKKIFKAALEEMREEGQIFSFLYPFSNPYYRQFGYECCCRVQITKIPLTAFKDLKMPGHAKHFVYEEDIETVKTLYNQFIEDKNLAIVRDDRRFQRLFQRDAYKELYHTYIWHNAEGKATGYLSFLVVEGAENDMEVHELIWEDGDSLKGLLGFLYKFHPYYTHFTGMLPDFLNLHLLLSEPYQVQAALKAHGMNRIADVEKALALLPCPEGAGQITIGVTDDFCEWNTGTFVVTWENGKVTVNKSQAAADLQCNIQALTQLVTGYVTVQEMKEFAGLCVNSREELLNALFPKKKAFIRDHF